MRFIFSLADKQNWQNRDNYEVRERNFREVIFKTKKRPNWTFMGDN